MNKDLLVGWQKIERYIGLPKEIILAQGYPVHGAGEDATASRPALLNHALSGKIISVDRGKMERLQARSQGAT